MPRAKKVVEPALPPLPVEDEEEEDEEDEEMEPDYTYGGGEEIGGEPFGHSHGRQVAVPLWNRAANAPKTARLRVQFIEIDGNATECGYLPYDASLENLIRKWPKQGTFLVQPIDQMNRPMSHDPLKFTIAEDHDILRAIRGAGGDSLPGFISAQIPPEVWEFLRSQSKNQELQIKMLQNQNQDILSEMRNKDEQVSKERMALAVNNTSAALDVQQQLIERDQLRQDNQARAQSQAAEAVSANAEQRHTMAMERMQAQNQNQNQMMQANQQMMIQMLQNSAQADRQRAEDDRARVSDQVETMRVRNADRRKDERTETQARETQRWEMQDRRQQMEQQYHERQMELVRAQHESNDPFKAIEKLLDKGSGVVELVKALGIDKLLGGGGPAGFMGVASETLSKAIEGYLEIAKIQAGAAAGVGVEGAPQIPEQPEQQYQVQLPDGQTAVMTENEVQAYQAQVQAYQQQMAQSATPPQDGEIPQASPEPPAETPAEALPFNPFAETIGKLDPKVQKSSRKSIRETIGLLRQADAKKWEAIITAQITKSPEVIEYFAACSLAYALQEGGADAKMITSILGSVKEMEIIGDKIRLS